MTSESTRAILRTVKRFIREPHAWPGGYPLILVMTDGETLCPACARAEFRQIVEAVMTKDKRCGWHPEGVDVHYEGEALHCANCGHATESAYGDPADEEHGATEQEED